MDFNNFIYFYRSLKLLENEKIHGILIGLQFVKFIKIWNYRALMVELRLQ
jgi:hypothetical protein